MASSGPCSQHSTLVPVLETGTSAVFDRVWPAANCRLVTLGAAVPACHVTRPPRCLAVDAVSETATAETPDDGIEDFLDLPRFSTGYAALHHTIGFMPETHMLKPFAGDDVDSGADE